MNYCFTLYIYSTVSHYIYSLFLFFFKSELVQSNEEKLITDYMDVSNDCKFNLNIYTYLFLINQIFEFYSIDKKIHMAGHCHS